MKRTGGRRSFVGFDTETINNGQIFLITNSNKEYLLFPTIDEILEYLMKYEFHSYIGMFYNLDYDIKSLIMTIANQNNKLDDVQLYLESQHLAYKDYVLNHVPGKKLTIWKNPYFKTIRYWNKELKQYQERDIIQYEKKSVFYDIMQFYLNQYGKPMKLQDASEQFLKLQKLDVDDISTCDVDRLKVDKDYREKWVRYGIRDSVLCKQLSYKFFNDIKPIINSRKLLSPAYLSQLHFSKQLKELGLMRYYRNKWTTKYEQEILFTYYGGRFETLKKGISDKEKLYLYDINSAYPYAMNNIKCLTGQATLTKNNDNLELDKCYPIIKVEIDYMNEYCNLLAFRNDDKLVYFPSVRRPMEKWITRHEIELLDLCNIDYTIKKVIHFWHNNEPLFPFIEELYKMKKEGEHKKVVKIILNSAYGKTIERTPRYKLINDWIYGGQRIVVNGTVYHLLKSSKVKGKLYNPLWGTEITGFCRNQIIKPILKNKLQNNLYQIATDSVLLDRKLDLPLSKELGEWGLDILDNPIIYGNGLLEYDTKYDNEGNIVDRGFKSRGFSCSDVVDNDGRTIRTAKQEFQDIILNGEYDKTLVVPMHHYKKWGFDLIHSFQEQTKHFSLEDKKRRFRNVGVEYLQNNTLDSKPLLWN